MDPKPMEPTAPAKSYRGGAIPFGLQVFDFLHVMPYAAC